MLLCRQCLMAMACLTATLQLCGCSLPVDIHRVQREEMDRLLPAFLFSLNMSALKENKRKRKQTNDSIQMTVYKRKEM